MNPARQDAAVIKEYLDAIEDGDFGLAGRILDANPDLVNAILMTSLRKARAI